MKIFKNILSVITILLVFVSSNAQDQKAMNRANSLYKTYAYVEATKIYEKIAGQGYVNQDILQRLGNSYFFRADYLNALKWYDQLFEKVKSGEYTRIEPEYYYRYAQCLKSAERYKESNKAMEKFVELTGDNNEIARLFVKNKDYLAEIENNSGRVDDIKDSNINTKYSEYAPAFLGSDKLAFTANTSPSLFERVSEWTDASMFSIYMAKRVNDSLFREGEMNSNINTSFNESSPTFNNDGTVMYFTRNNPYTFNEAKTKNKDYILKIYKAELIDGDWGNVQKLKLSGDAYSDAHPALSPDGKYLYFASNMPGSLGDSDIYRVEIKDGGNSYGRPENLGEMINTNGRETFPYVTSDNVLYFASDGHPGLGGLDIFAAQIYEDNQLGQCQNAGRPINSPYDDFALILDTNTHSGYFSSNRVGGKGSDDIYSFKEKRPLILRCTKAIHGIVKDAITGEVLETALLSLSNKQYEEKSLIQTDVEGSYNFDKGLVFCEEEYFYLKASKEGYETKEDKVTFGEDEDIFYEILLEPIKQKVEEGTDLAKVFKIQDIYFDFNRYNIRPDAEIQLSQIVQVMKDNPDMVIEVRSYTDSRGNANYNKRLSDRRAKSTVRWIVSKGISSDRISGKGYGEANPINECADDSDCTEAEHQENRRSEFIIVKM